MVVRGAVYNGGEIESEKDVWNFMVDTKDLIGGFTWRLVVLVVGDWESCETKSNSWGVYITNFKKACCVWICVLNGTVGLNGKDL